MYRRHKGLAVLNLVVVLAVVVMFNGAAYAEGPVLHLATTQPEQGQTFTAVKALPAAGGQRLVPVVVRLQSEPLATYSGGLPGLAPTGPAATGGGRIDLGSANSKAYLARLAREHQDFKSRVASIVSGARVTHDFSVVLNATSMLVPSDKIAELAAQPGVAAVYPDELLHLNTDNSPQFIGAPTAWRQLGGQESAGQGVIVGVLDTGIWPEHPSFSNPDPSGKPYPPPPPTQDNHARACQFSGGANPGPAFACNNKLIGAQRFMSTYEAVIGLTPAEYTSARDDDGHGTHTSSTSAGNASVAASIFGISRGNVSGIAPRAYVMMYKVCGAEGCFGSDSAAAVEQAIRDGVNVINFSISGGANPYSDAVELAFLDAYQAGVFVAASAGNAGPAADTTDHRGPWTTTVAASTQNRAFQTTATVSGGGASLALSGASITKGIGAAEVIVPTGNEFCAPFTGSLTGKIVVCERGAGLGRAEKGYNVQQAGGVGMILYNNAPNVTDLETDNHYVPAVHIQYAQGQALLAFLAAHAGATASWPPGAKVAAQGDVMASFSSRGGPGQTLGVSKPDITAPGVQILAGASPQHLPPPAGVALGPQGELFQAIAGTSMSSPHIAGSAALIKALHPTWTPGQIKSALMTTAVTSVVKEDGTTPANAFDDGSGRVNLNQAGDPGLTFDETAAGYVAHQADLWNANYPSVFVPVMPGLISVDRTAHNTTNRTTAWQLKVVYPANADFKISVPPAIVVPAGGDRKFSIVINGGDVPLGQVRMATLYLTQSGDDRRSTTLHIPITFIRKQAAVALTKSCAPAIFARGQTTTCTITASNGTFSNAPVSIVDRLPDQLRVVPGSVAGGVGALNVVFFRGTLAGAQPPDVSVAAGLSPAGGYLPLADFGIAPIAGVGDETAANFNVPSFTFAGESYSQVGVVSNGYVIVGGAAGSADIQFANQHLPDPVRPNNVIAPFWTDFNPAAGGEVRIGVLTDGVDSWIVVDYAGVKEYSTAAVDTFEVWIGINTDTNPAQDISMVYGPLEGTGDGGLMTVGAENNFGNRGASYYFNGTGTPPTPSTELVVSSIPGVPGETHVTTFRARGQQTGKWTNYASMTSDLFQGASIAPFSGEVTR